MKRRIILTGMLAMAAGPALAQSSPAADSPAAADAPAMKTATPLTASDAVTRHMEDTMAAGAMSLATSRIAVDKVSDPMLKQFAKFEVAEQETIASVLKSMMTPNSPPLPTVKPPTEAELIGAMDAKGKAAVMKMQDMKAGKAFERDYVKAQIEGHHTLLAIQETYLKTPDNLAEANVAKLAKGMILEHLTLLGDLEKKLG